MALEKAMWAHGHSMVIEYPSRIKQEWRAGFFIRVIGKKDTTNWFHFAIPTPVIVNNNRLAIDSALVRYRSKSTLADIISLHVYDGEKKITDFNGLNLSSSDWIMQRFIVSGKPNVKWGIGISIGVRFKGSTDTSNTMEFASAGVDFLP